MYYRLKLLDTIRVPPDKFGEELDSVVIDLLREKLEGRIDKTIGSLVAIISIDEIGEGHILPGDGAVYYEIVFDALAYRPEMQEVLEGEIVEVLEFGAFIGIGSLDGLLHISQITDDYISYDEKNSRLVGKEKKQSLTEGDSVRCRIVAISLNEREPRDSKIGLTMRQPYLGKLDWIEEEINEGDSK